MRAAKQSWRPNHKSHISLRASYGLTLKATTEMKVFPDNEQLDFIEATPAGVHCLICQRRYKTRGLRAHLMNKHATTPFPFETDLEEAAEKAVKAATQVASDYIASPQEEKDCVFCESCQLCSTDIRVFRNHKSHQGVSRSVPCLKLTDGTKNGTWWPKDKLQANKISEIAQSQNTANQQSKRGPTAGIDTNHLETTLPTLKSGDRTTSTDTATLMSTNVSKSHTGYTANNVPNESSKRWNCSDQAKTVPTKCTNNPDLKADGKHKFAGQDQASASQSFKKQKISGSPSKSFAQHEGVAQTSASQSSNMVVHNPYAKRSYAKQTNKSTTESTKYTYPYTKSDDNRKYVSQISKAAPDAQSINQLQETGTATMQIQCSHCKKFGMECSVTKIVNVMKNKCPFCNESCNGVECRFRGKKAVCFGCHQILDKMSFHKRQDCPCKNLTTKSKAWACTGCFYPISFGHQKCPVADRIKSVLLAGFYKSKGSKTPQEAQAYLQRVYESGATWFKEMHECLKTLNMID